jgi:hypothetical protein
VIARAWVPPAYGPSFVTSLVVGFRRVSIARRCSLPIAIPKLHSMYGVPGRGSAGSG